MSALDIEHPAELLAYLQQSGRIAADEKPTFAVLSGGVSNRTVYVERPSGEAWVLKQALPKLRVAVDWFSDPMRVEREAEGLRWLGRLTAPGTIPELVFEDKEKHILAMTAISKPHDNWKTLLLNGDIQTDHIVQFGCLLGDIHRNAWQQRDTLAILFDERAFFESLRLEPYYGYSASQVPAAAEFINTLMQETRSLRLTLVHGDYSPKNVLVYKDKLILLDHEVIHWGDPGFDLGFALTHLLSKAHHLLAQRQLFAAAARRFWQDYVQTLGDIAWQAELEPRAVRHTLACLLARVAGRSPLEYLDTVERERQQQAVVTLLAQPPMTIDQLTDDFLYQLD